MVIVGLMLAVAPRILVPRLGLQRAILSGLLIFAGGLIGTGLSPTPAGFVGFIFVVSVGCMAVPALQALLTNLGNPDERGALLGGLGSLNELTSAVASTMYAAVLAAFTSDNPPLPLQGMHFILGAGFLLVGFAIASYAFSNFSDEVAKACDTSSAGSAVDY